MNATKMHTSRMADTSRTLNAYFTYLNKRREAEGPKPTALGTSGRGSMAGSCSRQIGLQMLDVPESDPIDSKTLLAFHIGTALHEMTQEAMEDVYKMRSEAPVDLQPLGFPISGNVDGIYTDPENRNKYIVWELKSKTSFGFKLARRSGEPEKHEVAQAAMYALGKIGTQGHRIDVTSIHLTYLCKDTSYGRDATMMGQTLEWLIGLDEPVPGQDGMTPRQIGLAEANRIKAIDAEVNDGFVPERFVPEHGLVDNVPMPDSKQQPWRCRYCRYNSLCATLPTDQTPIKETVVQLLLEERETSVGFTETS
mgnify:FL=1